MTIHKKFKKRLKIVAILTGVLLLLYVVTAVLMLTLFKEKIQEQVTATLKEKINGEINIESFRINIISNFPNASFTIKDLEIVRAGADGKKNEIVNIKYIYLHIHLLKLIYGKVELKRVIVKNSDIHIYRLPNGLKNTEGLLKKSENKGTENVNSTINELNVSIDNVHITYEDTVIACNYFDFTINNADIQFITTATGFTVNSKNNTSTHQIIFNKDRGSALKDRKLQMQIRFDWNTTTQTGTILPTRIKDKDESFTLLGSISLQEKKELQLIIYNHEISLQNALVLATPYTREKLTGFNFEDPLSAQMVVKSNLIPNLPPDIDIYFNSLNNTFTGKSKKLNKIDFSGHYMNHLNDTLFNDESNNALFFDTISGFYEGIPFNGKFILNDFTNPVLDMRVKCNTKLAVINNAIDTSIIRFNSGEMDLDLRFKGALTTNDTLPVDTNAIVNGRLALTGADYVITKNNYHFKNITGSLNFDKQNLIISNLPVTLNNNQTTISGEFKNISNNIIHPEAPLYADITILADEFNINNFPPPTVKSIKPSKQNNITQNTEQLLNSLRADIKLNANQIIYKKLVMSNAIGVFTISNNSIHCSGASAYISDGKAILSGNLNNLGNATMPFDLQVQLSNIDIEKIFKGLNNFNQTAVTADVIDGKVSSSISLNGNLNKQFQPVIPTLNGKVDVKVKNGALHNLKALQEITSVIFKNKDLTDIQFATINHTSIVKNGDVLVEEMNINSSLIIFLIEGTYSFADNTELYFKIPLKSLKNADEKYLEPNKIKDEKTGISLLFKLTKTDGKAKITPVLFKRDKNQKQE